MVQVKIKNESRFANPEYATVGSSAVDLKANINEPVVIKSGERALIDTGISVQIPLGYEIQIRPRSGLGIKKGVTVNFGTIDSDYRGKLGVILFNISNEDFTVEPGERIGQAVLVKVEQIEWIITDELDETERGSGGFDHTGKI